MCSPSNVKYFVTIYLTSFTFYYTPLPLVTTILFVLFICLFQFCIPHMSEICFLTFSVVQIFVFPPGRVRQKWKLFLLSQEIKCYLFRKIKWQAYLESVLSPPPWWRQLFAKEEAMNVCEELLVSLGRNTECGKEEWQRNQVWLYLELLAFCFCRS